MELKEDGEQRESGNRNGGRSRRRSRGYSITIFPGGDGSVEGLAADGPAVQDCRQAFLAEAESLGSAYAIAGIEVCAQSGRVHLQAYLYLRNAVGFESIRRSLQGKFPGCHIEASAGTPGDNQRYCRKEGRWAEFGVLPRQGARSDLDAVRDAIRRTGSYDELTHADVDFRGFALYRRAFREYAALVVGHRERTTALIWVCGRAGSGKTTWVHRDALRGVRGDAPYVVSDHSAQWFDGYIGQTSVIFDDLCPGELELGRLLRIADSFPHACQIKGGWTNFVARRCYVSSNFRPAECFPRASLEQLYALLRRMDEFWTFHGRGDGERDWERPKLEFQRGGVEALNKYV